MFPVVCMYFLFAVTFIVAKGALLYFTPLLLVGIRMVLAGLISLAVARWRGEWGIIARGQAVRLFGPIVLFHVYGAYVCEFLALQWVSATKASLVYSLSPFITAFFSLLLFIPGDRLNSFSRRKCVGLVIGAVSLFCWIRIGVPAGNAAFITVPDLLLLASVASSSYGWVAVHGLIDRHRYSPFFINGIGMFFGGLLALATSYVLEGQPLLGGEQGIEQLSTVTAGASGAMALACCAFLVLVPNVVCYNLYAFLLTQYSATLLSFAGFLCPLFTALLDLLIYREPLTIKLIITLAGVAIGLRLFYQEEIALRDGDMCVVRRR